MLQDSDRFIPQRCCMLRENVSLKCELPVQCNSVLKQDMTEWSLQNYRRILEAALNIRSVHARLMRYTQESLSTHMQESEGYDWPVRSRKRPLMKQPHHLLDLPHFRPNFFLNLLDWGAGNYLAAALHKSIYLYALGDIPIELTEVKYGTCSSVKWDNTGEKLAVGTSESLIQVWNTRSRKVEAQRWCPCHKHRSCSINATVWHPSSKLCASGCSNGRLLVLWLHHHSGLQVNAHDGQISALRSSSDGRFLASSGEDGAVRVWYWLGLASVLEVTDYDYPVKAIAWHPWKPSYLVIGGRNDGTLSLWNVNKCTKQCYQMDQLASVTCLEFSPITGELVASVWIPGSVTDMNPLGRSVILVLRSLDKAVDRLDCPAGYIYSLLWSPDGRELATVSSDETLRIWYFLGPTSARCKDMSRYLKPAMPSNFTVPARKPSVKAAAHYTVQNSFGCTIR